MGILLVVGVSCSEAEPVPAIPPSSPPVSQVTGLITETHYEGEQMTRFVVESREGSFEILIDLEHDYGFDLKHLEEHRTEELPVTVSLAARDGDLYAVDIVDA